MNKISIIIPAYNEGERIKGVLKPLVEKYDQVLVINDGSKDETGEKAREAGAEVLENEENRGYIYSIKRGFKKADNEIVVTMDADGEHKPEDVERLVKPILKGKKDLVFGVREEIPRPSERFLNWLTNLKLDLKDSGTGFRAIRKKLAKKLKLNTACTCGTLALEVNKKGGKIGEVPIKTKNINKPKKVAWKHFEQFFHVLKYLLK